MYSRCYVQTKDMCHPFALGVNANKSQTKKVTTHDSIQRRNIFISALDFILGEGKEWFFIHLMKRSWK